MAARLKKEPAPNDLSPEALERIQKVVDDYPERWTGGVCGFDVLNREGVHVGGSPSRGACHAALSGNYGNHIVVNSHKVAWGKKNPEFILWVNRESPFAHGVLNSHKEKELFNHAAVIDTSKTGSAGALWLCKAMRHFQEDTWVVDNWSRLRDCGLTGLQAFIGADILSADGSPRVPSHCGLFGYGSPTNLRKVYDEMCSVKHLDGTQACRYGNGTGRYDYDGVKKNWGALKHKIEKKPDGWGGYTERKVPCKPEEYAAQLKEIFEGDPKNVG
jgi:hypothetical protein